MSIEPQQKTTSSSTHSSLLRWLTTLSWASIARMLCSSLQPTSSLTPLVLTPWRQLLTWLIQTSRGRSKRLLQSRSSRVQPFRSASHRLLSRRSLWTVMIILTSSLTWALSSLRLFRCRAKRRSTPSRTRWTWALKWRTLTYKFKIVEVSNSSLIVQELHRTKTAPTWCCRVNNILWRPTSSTV